MQFLYLIKTNQNQEYLFLQTSMMVYKQKY